MKYIKKFERLQDDFDSANDEEKQKMLYKALDFIASFETDFEVGDYIKYKEDKKFLGQEFANDIFIVTDIDGSNRPKKYRDKMQQGHATNLRTGKPDYLHFHNFEKCTEENIAQLKYNL